MFFDRARIDAALSARSTGPASREPKMIFGRLSASGGGVGCAGEVGDAVLAGGTDAVVGGVSAFVCGYGEGVERRLS